jgi:hypothetical protein
LPALTIAAYVTLVVTASGTLRREPFLGSGGRYLDRRSALAWVCALLSAFGLPWSGVPVLYYAGVGSWAWFFFAALATGIQRPDGRESCLYRRLFAAFNLSAVMAAIYAFMYATGAPGAIPSSEGISAINSLEGLGGDFMSAARALFLVSCIASFIPAYSPGDRVSALMSFSYSSFLAIAFLPPTRAFFPGMRPERAILTDAAGYFLWALVMHSFVMWHLSYAASAYWGRIYAAVNVALTAAGIYFLFAAL